LKTDKARLEELKKGDPQKRISEANDLIKAIKDMTDPINKSTVKEMKKLIKAEELKLAEIKKLEKSIPSREAALKMVESGREFGKNIKDTIRPYIKDIKILETVSTLYKTVAEKIAKIEIPTFPTRAEMVTFAKKTYNDSLIHIKKNLKGIAINA